MANVKVILRESIPSLGEERRLARSGTGRSSRKRTSSGRGASTAKTCGSSLRPAALLCHRRELATTAAALNGMPSWNRTFVRRVTVQVVRSRDGWALSARPACGAAGWT